MTFSAVVCSLVIRIGFIPVSCQAKWFPFSKPAIVPASFRRWPDLPETIPRGGGDEVITNLFTPSEPDETPASITEASDCESSSPSSTDEERYSRQVYTLGKRAHGLIRSTTIYLDGPSTSGLTWEVAKNLALSGIHKVVLVQRSSETTETAINSATKASLDDLGQAYLRAAQNECKDDDSTTITSSTSDTLLMEYIKRLNPSVEVQAHRLKDEEELLEPSLTSDGSINKNNPIIYMALDQTLDVAANINKHLRRIRIDGKSSVKFVCAATAGVYGHIFCDFGDSFTIQDPSGESPASIPLLKVEKQESELAGDGRRESHQILVHCMPGEKHDVSKGDILEFQLSNGSPAPMTALVEKVHSPFLIQVTLLDEGSDLNQALNDWNEAVTFSRVQQPEEMAFLPLHEALPLAASVTQQQLITPSDLDKSFDATRQATLLACFANLNDFAKLNDQRIPRKKDRYMYLDSVKSLIVKHSNVDSNDNAQTALVDEQLVKYFCQSCAAKFTPLQGVMGAIAAQEALKAASAMYTPIHQFLLMDCQEVLQAKEKKDKPSASSSSTRNAGLRYIVGDAVVDKLEGQRLFVVGAGAIGCEVLKNLAAMGVALKSQGGKIILTDMDTIEKSNLSRQLLFRDADLGKFKSTAAEYAAKRFNDRCEMEVHSAKVGETSRATPQDYPFQQDFWAKDVDIIINALDNVDARLYMDSQCVKYQKSLVDSGTMGPKGNVQVVVPYQSESYASSADPPDEAIPVCTLKNFPYAISHTIQWARDLFDGLYVKRAQQANDFVNAWSKGVPDTNTLASQMIHATGEEVALTSAKQLAEDLTALVITNTSIDKVRQHSLQWAVSMAQKLFVEAVDNLFEQHPPDSKDEDGEDFWSGTRRPPTKLLYKADPETAEDLLVNRNLVDFVKHGARLRSETFLADQEKVAFTNQEAEEALSAALSRNDKSDDNSMNPISQPRDIETNLSRIPLHDLKGQNVRSLFMADFEKDDDSNGHVDFITAASNLRAISYGIPPVDQMETRRVAGKIIPAMITTTAVVSALSCLELIKLVQNAPLELHRNGFINLALPFFAFTAPLPAERTPGLNGASYTLWDQLSITESSKAARKGGMTMKSLLKKIRKLAIANVSDDDEDVSLDSIQVASLSLGPYLLYANFLHEDDKTLLKSSIWNVIQEAIDDTDGFEGRDSGSGDDSTQQNMSATENTFSLTAVVEDIESGEEVELPAIVLSRNFPSLKQ